MGAAFELRPGRPSDRAAVLDALAVRDRHDTGTPHFSGGFLADAWRVASFDPGRDSVVAESREGKLAGYAARLEHGEIAFVLPEREGMGIGSRLLEWLHSSVVEPPTEHRQRIPATNARAAILLTGSGYRLVRSYRRLERSLSEPIAAVPPPAGIAFARLDVAADARSLHTLDDKSFKDTADYAPHSFEAFLAEHLAPDDLDADLSTVARREDEAVGMILCRRRPDEVGYVDLLAVAPGARRRGLGRALLLGAFGAFTRAGLRRAQLEVASDNLPALALYEQLRMGERHQAHVYQRSSGWPQPVAD